MVAQWLRHKSRFETLSFKRHIRLITETEEDHVTRWTTSWDCLVACSFYTEPQDKIYWIWKCSSCVSLLPSLPAVIPELSVSRSIVRFSFMSRASWGPPGTQSRGQFNLSGADWLTISFIINQWTSTANTEHRCSHDLLDLLRDSEKTT